MSARAKAAAFSGRVQRPEAEKLIIAYERDCRLQRLAKTTISTRGYALRNFARFLEGQGVHILDVGREDIRAWVEEFRIIRGRSTGSTKNNRLFAVLCG